MTRESVLHRHERALLTVMRKGSLPCGIRKTWQPRNLFLCIAAYCGASIIHFKHYKFPDPDIFAMHMRQSLAMGADRAILLTTDMRTDQELQPLAVYPLQKCRTRTTRILMQDKFRFQAKSAIEIPFVNMLSYNFFVLQYYECDSFAVHTTAKLLQKVVEKESPNLVLCGKYQMQKCLGRGCCRVCHAYFA